MDSHFVKSYAAHIKKTLSRLHGDQAMEYAVGGNFKPFGVLQRNLLMQYGLKPESSLVDVGCGSGRLAYALRDLPQLKYLGTDVAQELLDHAGKIVERPDWGFVRSTDLTIPVSDGSQDFVCAFSVFTHLLHAETYVYLEEIKRVLKPAGRLVFSFLEFAVPAHWAVFEKSVADVREPNVLSQFIETSVLQKWCDHLRLKVVAFHPGSEMHIVLPEPVTMEDGSILTDKASMGQSVCVLEKSA
jgi:SAM-dependent methyltransferase